MVDLPSRRAVLRTTAEVALTGISLRGYAAIARAQKPTGGGTASSRALQRRNRTHFDQKLLVHKAVDDKECVGRVSPDCEQSRKFASAVLRELRNVLRVDEIAGERYNIGKICALRG